MGLYIVTRTTKDAQQHMQEGSQRHLTELNHFQKSEEQHLGDNVGGSTFLSPEPCTKEPDYGDSIGE